MSWPSRTRARPHAGSKHHRLAGAQAAHHATEAVVAKLDQSGEQTARQAADDAGSSTAQPRMAQWQAGTVDMAEVGVVAHARPATPRRETMTAVSNVPLKRCSNVPASLLDREHHAGQRCIERRGEAAAQPARMKRDAAFGLMKPKRRPSE